jgi:cytochrome c peroxidase
MKKIWIISSALVLSIATISNYSCKKKTIGSNIALTDVPDLSTSYDYATKTGVNNDAATLGRVLFYDRRLSANNSTSCGSCHKQALAFADNEKFSRGFDGRTTRRNTLAIQNLVGFTQFMNNNVGVVPDFNNQNQISLFWDGRQNDLSKMVLKPIANHIEMHMDNDNQLIAKLNSTTFYPDLFNKAFGTSTASIENVSFALEAFIQTMNSRSSKFDKSLNTFNNANNSPVPLSALEQKGLIAFTSTYNCNTCHNISPSGYNGSGEGFANIGLDANYTDNGVGEITNKKADNGKFKIPNLRNVALTAPYMHDGRFATLDDVIEHYSHNIQPNENVAIELKDLDLILKMINKGATESQVLNAKLMPMQKNVSNTDKQAIIAFLKTLTDYDFVTNPMYSNPFVKK